MAQILIRNIEDSVKEALQQRARKYDKSMEEVARDLLRAATFGCDKHKEGLGTRIAKLFGPIGFDGEFKKLEITLNPVNFGDEE